MSLGTPPCRITDNSRTYNYILLVPHDKDNIHNLYSQKNAMNFSSSFHPLLSILYHDMSVKYIFCHSHHIPKSVTAMSFFTSCKLFLFVLNSIFIIIILHRRFYCLFCKNRAVYLVCRKSVKCFCHCLIGKL